jgi:uncharacterized repeat protein (TIGR03987 family)
MKPVLIAGTLVVNLALISYSVFIFFERKTAQVTRNVLSFLTVGVFFDASATTCMIVGSSNSPFTLHGILGYSALAGMIFDAILVWRRLIKRGLNSPLPSFVHKYSLLIYCWWIIAYITGALLVMFK